MERYDLASRHPIHMGRMLYTNTYYICSVFANSMRNYLNYSGYDCSLIGNMNETPVFFNMPMQFYN